MTIYHFVNCVLLTFGPPVIIYKFSPLSEYGTIWRPVTGVTAYLATQAIKILLIASLVSLSPFWEHAIDCIGMYYFLVSQQKAIVTSVKILSLALGWSVTDFLFTRLSFFYMNTRSMQFDWSHLINAADANLVLVQNICICALLWYWSRKANKLYLSTLITYLLVISILQVGLTGKAISVATFALATLLLVD